MRHSGSFISAISRATEFLNWVGITLVLTLMMLLVTLAVFMRYVFNSPLRWGDDVVGIMLMTTVFFSIGRCWVARGHIQMGILYDRVTGRGRAALDALSAAVGLFFWGLLFSQSLLDIFSSIALHEITDDSGILLWPMRIILSAGLLMFVLELILSLVRAVVGLISASEEKQPKPEYVS